MKDIERVAYKKDITYFKFYMKRLTFLLNEVDEKKEYVDINDVIEIYNVKQYIDNFTCESWSADETDIYKKKATSISKIVGKFFSAIDDSNLLSYCEKIESNYHKSFWAIMCDYKRAKIISPNVFEEYLNAYKNKVFYFILKYKILVDIFDKEISKFLIGHSTTAEMIIYEYLAHKESNHTKKYFPKSLTPDIMGTIIQQYIESPNPNLNYIQLLLKSSPKKEIGFTNKMKVLAKKIEEKAATEIINKNGFGFQISVKFSEKLDKLAEIKHYENSYEATYNPEMLLDDKTNKMLLLYNFIYAFAYYDAEMRNQFVRFPDDQSSFEFFCGIKAEREYRISFGQQAVNKLHFMQMNMYDNLLRYNKIELENLIKWFFEEHLKEDFSISGFVYNPSNEGSKYLEKAKAVASEMDSILKQYRMYCEEGCIDREVFEISSEQTIFETLPSLQKNKYIYAKEIAYKAINMLYSGVIPFYYKSNSEYDNLLELFDKEPKVLVSNFEEHAEDSIKFLQEHGFIYITEGVIELTTKVKILEYLKEHRVISYSYCNNLEKQDIDEMLEKGQLENHNTLFSIEESNYMNYILNKAKFDNGLDLRNKYLHGSYPLDDKQNAVDYYQMLIIMMMVLFKIHEEFLLRDETKPV